ncbi:hypothetical protein [Gordonia caeni]|uniref:Uncharacterized protein n=1 Tax=Gordonia caeni TaxID=1007097 RepID=A0ABP7P8R2_9ACTN
MSAVEINAGTWYLRALRADDRLSDVPALTDLGLPDPTGYVAGADGTAGDGTAGDGTAGDGDGIRCVWAICIPTTGELVALIGVAGTAGDGEDRPAQLRGLARSGYAHALTEAAPSVCRFAQQALGLAPGELISAPP